MTTAETGATTNAEGRIGQVLSARYRILSLLGEGGMGAVYLAEHTHMRKRVALKLLHAEMSENAEVLARFEREAMAAARIEHPNVATATDFGRTEDGGFFLVLEYIEGQSLRAVLESGALSPVRALHVARQIASGLARAHEAGIVHRDLKPENVMLVHRGEDPDFVKVLDFGIAKMPAEPAREGVDPSQPLTRLGTILGTPEYMAPEQALGEAVTPKADLYALGVILYEMLTGKHPFDAPDRMAVLSFHIVAPVPPMRDRAPGLEIPPVAEAIARKLLEKDAKARPDSARALVAEIDAAAGAMGLVLRGAPGTESSPRLPTSSSRALPPSESAPPGSVAASSSPAGSDPQIGEARTGAWSAEDSLAKTSYGAQAAVTTGSPALPGPKAFHASARAALEPHLATIRTWPRHVQLGVLAAPIVGFLLVLVSVLAMRGPKPADAADAPSASASAAAEAPSKAPPRAPEEAVRTAGAAHDVAALEALAKSYPEDPAVLSALVLAHQAQGRPAEALRTVRALLEKAPEAPVGADVVEVVVAIAAKGKAEDDDEAFAILEGPLGARGVDALIELSTLTSGPRVRLTTTRAKASLAKPEVRAKASPAAAVLLDMRAAKECSKRRDLLDRARDEGDVRMLGTLKAMRPARGCGFAGLRDCWPCLHEGGTALEDAIAGIEKRLPALAAESAGSASPGAGGARAPRR